jgi:hypothetical protein
VTALQKIADTALLAEIAKSVNCLVDLGSHGNYAQMVIVHLEVAALQRIADEKALRGIAQNAVSHWARDAASAMLAKM